MAIPPQDETALDGLRNRLLRDRPPDLSPEQGGLAFQFHKVLAAAVHSATLLDRHAVESQTGAWVRYMASYFPPARNAEADAKVLWEDWRTALLKDGAPGPRVLIAHGQPESHWHREPDGRLCINLEDMWSDLAYSVDRLIDFLRTNDERRSLALERSRKGEIAIVAITTGATSWAGTTTRYASGGVLVSGASPRHAG